MELIDGSVGVFISGIGTKASITSKTVLPSRGARPLHRCVDVVGGVEICSLPAFCYPMEACNLGYGGSVPSRTSIQCVV